ncbi:MAG: hypothetical protein J6D03_09685 [Clostridia bacterium]|nr:hypothetical protein [Clostridia bacterium]
MNNMKKSTEKLLNEFLTNDLNNEKLLRDFLKKQLANNTKYIAISFQEYGSNTITFMKSPTEFDKQFYYDSELFDQYGIEWKGSFDWTSSRQLLNKLLKDGFKEIDTIYIDDEITDKKYWKNVDIQIEYNNYKNIKEYINSFDDANELMTSFNTELYCKDYIKKNFKK